MEDDMKIIMDTELFDAMLEALKFSGEQSNKEEVKKKCAYAITLAQRSHIRLITYKEERAWWAIRTRAIRVEGRVENRDHPKVD